MMPSIEAFPAIRDGIGEWWVYPLATYLPGPVERTVVGAIASNGTVLAVEFNHQDGTETRVEVGSTVPDDHNCPAIWAAEGRRLVMMWTQHGRDTLIQARVSDADGAVQSLAGAVAQDFTASTGTSYTQIHRIEHLSDDAQDTFWVFYRIGTLAWAYVQCSVDQATGTITWGAQQQLVTGTSQAYLSVMNAHAAGDQTLRVAWGFNPGPDYHPLMYIEINTVTGAITSPLDPTLAANMSGAGLPMVSTDITPLLPDLPPEQSRRLFYVRPGPALPAVAYAEWDETTPDEAVYKVTQLTASGEWTTRDYGTSGPRLGFSVGGNYIAGMAFPDPCPDDRVVVARKVGGMSTVEAYRTDDTGTFPLTLVEDGTFRLARPIVAKDGGPDRVVVSRVRHYGADYTDYLADVVALYGAQNTTTVVVRSASPTILCGELRTGRILGTVPVAAATWEQRLREGGSVAATIPLLAREVTDRPELFLGLEGARSFLAAEYNGTVLEAGPIWVHDVAGTTLRVQAGSLLSLFDHRVVIRVLSAGQNAATAKALTYSGLSLGSIARGLIATAMAHTGGDLPILLPAKQPGTAEREYPAYELATVADRVRELMRVAGGPDVAFVPELARDGLSIRWRMLVGSTEDPMIHQAGPDWEWDTTVPASSVSDLRVKRDWSGLTMRAWATGEGQDEALLIDRAVDFDLANRGYPLMESVSSHPTVKRRPTLKVHAQGGLRRGRRPTATWTLDTRLDGTPALSRVRPGDFARVRVGDHPYLKHYLPRGWYRTRVLAIRGGLGMAAEVEFRPQVDAR